MRTQDVMSGLQRQNKTLSATMSALRPNNGRGGAYYETDVDTMKTRDISIHNQVSDSVVSVDLYMKFSELIGQAGV